MRPREHVGPVRISHLKFLAGRTVKVVVRIALVLIVMLATGWLFFTETRTGQDFLLRQVATAASRQAPVTEFDGLRVFMCGTSSALISARAQACVAVMAGDSLYIVDAGTGSNATMVLAGESLQHLRAILLTHFHSDHIAGLAEFNLISWVGGRDAPLQVMGTPGIERVVAGFNEAFALDREYRVTHHGADLLDPTVGFLEAAPISAGVVVEHNGIRITAFPIDHAPVEPAFGYRFEYGGRSVVVSGDTVVTDSLRVAAQDADLLLMDALSLPIVQTLAAAAQQSGRDRQAKVLLDIQDYHAAAGDLAAIAESAGVGMLALYHLIPAPSNYLLERIFERDLPDDAVLTADGMVFESAQDVVVIHVLEPQ